MQSVMQRSFCEAFPIKESEINIPEGMVRTHFAEGTKRHVYIDKAALYENVRQNKNYLSCIVEEKGKKYLFHNVIFRGPAMLEYNRNPEVQAHQYLVTESALDGLTQPAWGGKFEPKPRTSLVEAVSWLWTVAWRRTLFTLGFVPIVGCVLGHPGYDFERSQWDQDWLNGKSKN